MSVSTHSHELSYEDRKIGVLRRLKRIDLKSCITSLKKYTKLTTRLFKAKNSTITIVDDQYIWVLASNDNDNNAIYSINRGGSFCDRLVQPDHSLALIIPDTSTYKYINEIKSESTVNKFYAGIALTIEDARIGTLFVTDTSPHDPFTIEDELNFREISDCIADVLQTQINLSDQLILGWTGLMVGVTHNLRTPLSVATLSISEANREITKLQNKYSRLIDSVDLVQTLDNCRDAEIAAQQLQLIIDANSNLGNMILSYESKVTPHSKMSGLSREAVHNMITRIRRRLLIMEDNHSIQWFINEVTLGDKIHKTYVDAIEQTLASAIGQFMVQHAEISVYINFESDHHSRKSQNDPLFADSLLFPNEGNIVVEITFQVEASHELHSDKIDDYKVIPYDNFKDGTSYITGSTTSSTPHNSANTPHTQTSSNGNSSVLGSTAISSSSSGKDYPINQNPRLHHQSHAGEEFKMHLILREFDTFAQRFELQLIERLLKVIGGRISKMSTLDGRSGRLIMHFPCQVSSNLSISDIHISNESKQVINEKISDVSVPTFRKVVLNRVLHENEEKKIDVNIKEIKNNEPTLIKPIDIINSLPTPEIEPEQTRALIIEDGIPVQKILSSWLRRRGCEVHTALNGKLGLEKLKEINFDIVLCDFLMPVQDGVTTMRLYQQHISTNPDNNIVPPMIIGISATANKEDLEEAFSYGMNFFCQKPLVADVLDFIVESYEKYSSDKEKINTIMEEKIVELTGIGKKMAIVSPSSLNDSNQ